MKFTAEFKFSSFLLIPTFVASCLFASFEPLPVGGRAAGMGEAYSAIVDDVFSVYYNPAGILQLTRPEIGTYYSQMYPGLTDNSRISRSFFAYGQPFGKEGRNGAIGVSYLSLDLPGLYGEKSMGVTYGREFHHRWNIGGSIKMLKKEIGSDDYSTNAINPVTGSSTGSADPVLAKGKDATAFGIDLGTQFRLTQNYAVGIAGRNLNSPDVGIGGGKDSAPAILSASIARRWRSGSLDVEATQWKGAEQQFRLSMGGEHWLKSGFGLRAGGSFGNSTSISAGASYKMPSIQFDYAFIMPLQGVEGTLGIQQVSLTIRLGKAPVDPVEQQLIKEREERIRAESEARYAKAERDRLKKQLYALTEEKTQVEQQAERESSQRALEEAKAQEVRSQAEKANREKAAQTKSVFTSYTSALADYNAKVSQGMGMAEKKRILEKILNEFNNKGVDLSTVNRELKSLKDDELKAKKDFDLSMSFYRRLVQQGASIEERRGMLERIIQKYKGTGIETGPAQDEMKTLK